MKSARLATQSRSALDARLRELVALDQAAPPVHGWIKAVRQGLGMTAAQLARRLAIKQPTVVNLEQSEVRGTIQLATLRRVAEALDCRLVYALVPKRPLEETVRKRAREVARRRIAAVEHSMLLEDQQVPAKDVDARLDELAGEIKPRELWEEE